MNTTAATRSKHTVYLLGSISGEPILGAKLPTVGQALSFFFWKLKEEKCTVRESAAVTFKEVEKTWTRAHLPMCQAKHGLKRLEKFYDIWRMLQKGSKRGGPTQKQKEEEFQDTLSKTLDLRHQDWKTLVICQEDMTFLEDQFSGRKATIGSLDKVFEKREKTKAEKTAVEHARKEKEKARVALSNRGAAAMLSDSDSASPTTSSSSESDGASPPKRKRPVNNIISQEVAASLDRTKTTDRMAVFTIAAISRAQGVNPEELALNKWTINRSRRSYRAQVMEDLQAEFCKSVHGPIVVHWDGKLLPDLMGPGKHEKVDRLPIIVSTSCQEQLLNVPKLPNASGHATADAVVASLENWRLTDQVKAMSFDTTASNTGVRGGAAVLIQEKLARDLLFLPCRHHIFEIVLSDVFQYLFGPSSGPDIPIFKRFKGTWSTICRNRPEEGILDEETAVIFAEHQDVKTGALNFALEAVQQDHDRDDFREFLELTIIYLGGVPPRGIRIMAPGAMHQARWMAKAIYGLKVFMFRSQFNLTVRETKALRLLNLFVTLVYAEAWFRSPHVLEAPLNDLNFFKKIRYFANIDEKTSTVAAKAMGRHTWYLGEELVALAFFDSRVPSDIKRKMAEALKNGAEGRAPKRPQLVDPASLSLSELVTGRTKIFFEILDVQLRWLEKEPDDWTTNSSYQAAKKAASSLAVVNDRAERGVKLIQDYNALLTKDESQKQALLHVVVEHRKRFPNANKSTVAGCSYSD